MPTSARFAMPVAQWMDGSGDPLTGGELRFYESGTSTPLDVYQDAALTTAFTQPVTADADGVWPEIWLAVGSYKVELQPSGGGTAIWTADPVGETSFVFAFDSTAAMTAVAKPLVPVLAEVRGYYAGGADAGGGTFRWDPSSTEDADEVDFFAADAGGVGRWVRIIENDVTPAMAGVKEDDVATADRMWPAFHTSGRRRRTIKLPGGVTRISEFDESGAISLTIEGHGRGYSILAPQGENGSTGGAGAVLFGQDIDDVTCSGFQVVGGDEGETNARYRCMLFTRCKRVNLYDIYAHSPGLLRDEPTGQCIAFTYCEDVSWQSLWLSAVPWGEVPPDLTVGGTAGFWGARELMVIGRQCYRIQGRDAFFQSPRDTALLITNSNNADIDRPQWIDIDQLMIDASLLPSTASYGCDLYAVGSVDLKGVKIEDPSGFIKNGIFVHNASSSSSDKVTTRGSRIRGCSVAGIKANAPGVFESYDDHVDNLGIAGSQGMNLSAADAVVDGARLSNAGGVGLAIREGIVRDVRVTDWDRDALGAPAIGVLQKATANLTLRQIWAKVTDADGESLPERPVYDLIDDPAIKQRRLFVDGAEAYGPKVYYKEIPADSFTPTVGLFSGRRLFSDQQPVPFAKSAVNEVTDVLDVRGYETVLVTNIVPPVTSSAISFSSATSEISIAGGGFGSFRVGQSITVSGSSSNNGSYVIAAVTPTTLTVGGSLMDESAGMSVTVTTVGRWDIDTILGTPGQVVTLVFQDSGSNVRDNGASGGNIKLASGAAFDPDLDDTLQLVVKSATAVLEIARSDN